VLLDCESAQRVDFFSRGAAFDQAGLKNEINLKERHGAKSFGAS
jgi:hypothetical protein